MVSTSRWILQPPLDEAPQPRALRRLNGCDGGPMSWPEFRLRGLISIGGRGETWAMGEALRGSFGGLVF